MRGIIGFTGEHATRNNILMIVLILAVWVAVIKFTASAKHMGSKTTEHGYLGVEKIDHGK